MLEAYLSGQQLIVRQLGHYTLELKEVLAALSPTHRWVGSQKSWYYPYSPGTLAALADVAQLLNVRLDLEGPLRQQVESLRAEYAYETQVRQQIQQCLDDRNRPLADYPTLMQPPPWWHQKIAYHWAVRVRVLYIACKPGLGKTRMAADIIRGKHSIGHIRKPEHIELPARQSRALGGRMLPARWGIRGGVLIVCPRAVIGEWVDQLWRFQNIQAVSIVGRDAARKRYCAGIPAFVHVCGYGSLEAVEDNEYDGVIADEGHYIANEDSNRTQRMMVMRESAAWAAILSGTPIPNQLPSLWSQFMWLDGGRTLGPSFDYYRRKFLSEGKWLAETQDDAETRVSRAISRVTLFMDMQTAFPDKQGKIQQVIRVPLTKEQLEYYEKVRTKALADIVAGKLSPLEGMARAVKLLEIVQGFVIDDNKNIQQFSSAKLKALEEMITGQGDLTDRKVIVWVAFLQDMTAITKMLEKKKIKYMTFKGGMADQAIAEMRDTWNNDPEQQVLVAMIQVGIGVNLHAPKCVDAKGKPKRCSTTIFYGLTDKVTQVEQAMDRVYRGDQVETCLYRYILSDGLDAQNEDGEPILPVDVRMYQTLQFKLAQSGRVAEGSLEYARFLLGG